MQTSNLNECRLQTQFKDQLVLVGNSEISHNLSLVNRQYLSLTLIHCSDHLPLSPSLPILSSFLTASSFFLTAYGLKSVVD